ncbi:hypothetical protein EVAR_51161_1 [Eumeta japonica]|uniref:Uncharacterized protein n=1 Tax=Eumeta variegata TaxID=151549 RepID=A0A4C1XFE6_EUMVA|nr:hypothetical protein EVAR_51161_1 [Eumeta japonica]
MEKKNNFYLLHQVFITLTDETFSTKAFHNLPSLFQNDLRALAKCESGSVTTGVTHVVTTSIADGLVHSLKYGTSGVPIQHRASVEDVNHESPDLDEELVGESVLKQLVQQP